MDKTIDPLGDCCYGMGFGPEGDGVELIFRAAAKRLVDEVMGDMPLQVTSLESMGFGPILRAARAQVEQPLGSFENIQWPQWAFDDKPESNAKPALPALTRQAGEKYKGLGFNDGMDQ